MKKHVFPLLLAGVMVFSLLTACGGKTADTDPSDSGVSAPPSQSPSAEPSQKPSEPSPVPDPSPETSPEEGSPSDSPETSPSPDTPATPSSAPSAAPSPSPAPSTVPSPSPVPSPPPSPDPTPDPTPVPASGVDLAAFAESLMENHEFSGFIQRMDPADADFGAVMLENSLPGLTALTLEQMEVYLCMVSFNTGEFALVQAKDSADAETVRGIFQGHIDSMTDDFNYPATIELWSTSAKVAVNGNYVMLVCHEDCDAIVNEFNALF